MENELNQEFPLRELFAALQFGVFEHVAEGLFRLQARPPDWLSRLVPGLVRDFSPDGRFPFLESFLMEAEDFWRARGGDVLRSGPWVETTAAGQEINLEASALRLGRREVLLIRELGPGYFERRDLLQKARENSLTYQRLLKEVQMKEVLLHCIVHDLAGPLTGVKGLFALLAREDLSEAGHRRLKIGEDAASRLENLINEILAVFSAEVESLEAFSSDPKDAPDFYDCARSVVNTLQAAATVKGVDLNLEGDPASTLKVVGETTRLERVLFNLVENALRHSPSGGSVKVAAHRHGEWVRVSVTDEGPGVEADLRESLFEKFQQGGRTFGKAGLGLYFCRIVVERWGGKIGYESRAEGGSCFWFALPAVGAAAGPEATRSTATGP